MSEQTGFIELDRAVEAITVGPRHRTDFGNIDELAVAGHEVVDVLCGWRCRRLR